MRKTWILLAGVLAIGGVAYHNYRPEISERNSVPQFPSEDTIVYHVTEDMMMQYYSGINDEYYGGQLPPIEFKFKHKLKDFWGQSSLASTTRSAPYVMQMDDRLQDMPPAAFLYLHHETCHIYLESTNKVDKDDDHGPNFQKCMLDKAKHGAFRFLW